MTGQLQKDRSLIHFHYLLVFILAVVLIYPPFFRGLFFDGEMLTAQGIIFSLFLVFLIYQVLSKGLFLTTPLDYVLGVFCLIYALSLLVAVVPREAWLEFLAVCAYFVVFLLVSRLAGEGSYRWLIYALIVGAIGVSLVGIGTGFGTFDFPGAMRGSRIYSSLQYPNTTAAFLTAGFFVAVGRIEGEDKNWIRAILGGTAFLLLVTFVFTMSRGAWLVFPVVLVLYWVLNVKKFVNSFIYTVIPGLMFLAVAMPIWEAVQESENNGWYYIALGFVVCFGLTYIFSYFFGRLESLQNKSVQYVLVGILTVVLLTGAGYGATNYDAALEMMPDVVERRIERIDFDETGLGTRGELMSAAWDITTDRPILGAGGGGWESLYHQYMERDYWATEVHSHLFQVGVETGLPGMIAFVGIWIALFYQFGYVLIKKGAEGKEYAQLSGIFVGAVALGGHSILDFNLSLGAVAIYLWALFGLVNYFYLYCVEEETESVSQRKSSGSGGVLERINPGVNRYFPYVSGVVALGFLVYSLVLNSGFNEAQVARAKAEAGQVEEALERYDSALSKDRLNHELNYELASVYRQVHNHTGESQYREKAITHAKRAVDLNPYYHPNLRQSGVLLLEMGQLEDGLELLEKSYQYHPHGENGFMAYAEGLIAVAERIIQDDEDGVKGARAEVEEYLERLIELREEYLEYHSEDSSFDLKVLKAYLYLEEYEPALEFMEEESIAGGQEGNLFRALTYRANDMEAEAEEIIDEVEEDEDREELKERYETKKELFGF